MCQVFDFNLEWVGPSEVDKLTFHLRTSVARASRTAVVSRSPLRSDKWLFISGFSSGWVVMQGCTSSQRPGPENYIFGRKICSRQWMVPKSETLYTNIQSAIGCIQFWYALQKQCRHVYMCIYVYTLYICIDMYLSLFSKGLFPKSGALFLEGGGAGTIRTTFPQCIPGTCQHCKLQRFGGTWTVGGEAFRGSQGTGRFRRFFMYGRFGTFWRWRVLEAFPPIAVAKGDPRLRFSRNRVSGIRFGEAGLGLRFVGKQLFGVSVKGWQQVVWTQVELPVRDTAWAYLMYMCIFIRTLNCIFCQNIYMRIQYVYHYLIL